MSLVAQVEKRIQAAIRSLRADGVIPLSVEIKGLSLEPPREAGRGDLSSNAAMVIASRIGMKPRELAEHIVSRLTPDRSLSRVEVAGPGFINFTVAPSSWGAVVRTILKEKGSYGRSDIGRGEVVNVEYVSANPTGPLHIGHCRGAVFGDALANLLEFTGYEVTREYYWNDAGAQIHKLIRSIFYRYQEAIGATPAFEEGLYPGEDLKAIGERLKKIHGTSLMLLPESLWQDIVRRYALPQIKREILRDLKDLGVEHDRKVNERSLIDKGKVAQTILKLIKKGHVYKGRLEKPRGGGTEDWEDREQTLFKSTAFGDDVDRALLKSDGSYTYFAADMAYHRDKLARGYKHLINVFGADHAGYLTRMKAVVAALSDGQADLDVKVCQLVKLFRGGEPVRMSKRAGTFVTLREVVDEVGRDAVRFMMLYRRNDAPLDFDLVKVREQSKDNPVFYVQYAHARAQSVFRMAKEAFPQLSADALLKAELGLLQDPGEIDVIKKLAAFPSVVEGATRAHEPHRLAFYLYDLASIFHTQWTKGNELPQLRFIQASDGTLTTARLALIRATAQVLASGLALIGVHAPDEMR